MDTAEGACMEVIGIDHLELYVGDAPQMARYFCDVFGFAVEAVAGPESGLPGNARSSVLVHGDVRLVLTAGLDARSAASEHVRAHGSGIGPVALEVTDARVAFDVALRAGAKPVAEPTEFEGSTGHVVQASFEGPGPLTHVVLERHGDAVPPMRGRSVPGSLCWAEGFRSTAGRDPESWLLNIDHLAVCLPKGVLREAVSFYGALGFHQSREEHVETARSAMSSLVVENATGTVKLVLLEPADARGGGESQISSFLGDHGGAGVQHVALLVGDILSASRRLAERGVEFLDIPQTYYDALLERVENLPVELSALASGGVLADRDEWGYLLQQFTTPIVSRRTLFLEIIERAGARGFGSANIRALFQAVERQQRRRDDEGRAA